jgi:hypothetical protein
MGINTMPFFRFAIFLFVITLGLSVVGAAPPQMSVAEIRPGMTGIGRTVFEGTRVDEFTVKIIGVIENVIGTRRNLILARLEGGPLANTGVIAGMSGSPVYVDGRLIGAVSYALGAFSKEPIAGITPIDEMTDATGLSEARPRAARMQLDFPLTPENLTTAFRRALDWNRPFADRPNDAQLIGVSGVSGIRDDRLGTLLRPIATPLVMSGFEPEVAELLGSAFRDQGFVPTGGSAAGAGAGEMPFEGPLKPGDAVGVNFLTGDLSMGATGTVTQVDKDRVYAFGHPMYNLGPTEFPMTRAYVYTVLPSLASSLKLSTTGDVIGTFLQDRATAIAGRLGPGPRTIPISLTLEAQRGPKHTFHFNVVNDQIFTPLMTYAAILETIASYERQNGTATYTVHGKARVKNFDDINFDNLFSGDQASTGAASYMVAPITYLVANDYQKVDLEALDFTIGSSEEPKTATLQRVWIDDPRPRAGHTVPLKIALRTFRGEDVVKTVAIQIPANATGTLSILASDGTRLGQSELRESRLPQQQRNVPQLIRTLNKGRRNNALYVKLLGTEAGAVVNGESLSSLPPSVLAVLEADRNGGSFNALQSATLGEWEVATEHVVSGSRTLTFSISN